MAEYYFDIETTHFDFDKAEIITIQWQRLNGFTGEPLDKINILKAWESSEEDILKQFYPNLKCNPFDFIFVGKNLFFDFCVLNERLKHYGLGEIDLRCLHERVSLDIKPILVIMNDGRFRGYDKVMPKTNPTTNAQLKSNSPSYSLSVNSEILKDKLTSQIWGTMVSAACQGLKKSFFHLPFLVVAKKVKDISARASLREENSWHF